jgi:CubicO group peptidase (beta-lactamase class C family)
VSTLAAVLERHVAQGTAPGVVAAWAPAGQEPVQAAAGELDTESIVRIQSMTKAVVAVATLRLVQAGRLHLDDPVARWLPELEAPRVLRTPQSPLQDTVEAAGPITVRHLLTNTSGYGMILSDSPLQAAMRRNGTQAGPEPLSMDAQAWVAALAELPLVAQPGRSWRYHHSFGLLGVLLARLTDRPLGDHLRDDLLDPLGMADTGYAVPPAKAHRLPAAYSQSEEGHLSELEPAAGGFYVEPLPFDTSHGELVSTVGDFARFIRMLAAGGRHDGREVLDPSWVAQMTHDQVPTELKTPESFFPGFWDGLGWGYGVAVETSGEHTGRFGWSGGLGTDFWVDPDGGFGIVLAQVEIGSPVLRLFADVQALR